MQITLTVPDEKVEKFRRLFLKAHPKPEESTLIDKQWVQWCIKDWLLETCHNEHQKEALEKAETEFDKDIVQ